MFHGDHGTKKFTLVNLVKFSLIDLNKVRVSGPADGGTLRMVVNY
jgi:hypothetical protein